MNHNQIWVRKDKRKYFRTFLGASATCEAFYLSFLKLQMRKSWGSTFIRFIHLSNKISYANKYLQLCCSSVQCENNIKSKHSSNRRRKRKEWKFSYKLYRLEKKTDDSLSHTSLIFHLYVKKSLLLFFLSIFKLLLDFACLNFLFSISALMAEKHIAKQNSEFSSSIFCLRVIFLLKYSRCFLIWEASESKESLTSQFCGCFNNNRSILGARVASTERRSFAQNWFLKSKLS